MMGVAPLRHEQVFSPILKILETEMVKNQV